MVATVHSDLQALEQFILEDCSELHADIEILRWIGGRASDVNIKADRNDRRP